MCCLYVVVIEAGKICSACLKEFPRYLHELSCFDWGLYLGSRVACLARDNDLCRSSIVCLVSEVGYVWVAKFPFHLRELFCYEQEFYLKI